MPRIAELFFKTAIVFLVIGIGIGLMMAISQNHAVMGAHAHINLLGWVTSALFGGYYALNPAKAEGRLPMTHYAVYTIGVVVMTASLYMLLSGNTAFETPVAIGSMITFLGVLIFAWIAFAPAGQRAARPIAAE
ncbi:hypothetical protein [Devosia nitrariae]|uniref:Uncharacterized protein n=1 Tax=Devosia nitrariae TaxID=2071872 RepID=A0ABQ5VYF6_9HYPH|nr:hypothetical protein [Devosia nitrariae]GLQ52798.1 hypothetical protein GCM10010862_00560 [Devosia nitrariae]